MGNCYRNKYNIEIEEETKPVAKKKKVKSYIYEELNKDNENEEPQWRQEMEKRGRDLANLQKTLPVCKF